MLTVTHLNIETGNVASTKNIDVRYRHQPKHPRDPEDASAEESRKLLRTIWENTQKSKCRHKHKHTHAHTRVHAIPEGIAV